MSTSRPPPAARAPLQDVSRAPPPATDDGQQLGTLGGVLGDDLSQPDTLGTSSRASGTHPGGPAAYLQQFRGKGEGVPIQLGGGRARVWGCFSEVVTLNIRYLQAILGDTPPPHPSNLL